MPITLLTVINKSSDTHQHKKTPLFQVALKYFSDQNLNDLTLSFDRTTNTFTFFNCNIFSCNK